MTDVDPVGYFGDTNILTDEKQRRRFLTFCASPHGDPSKAVTRIYLSAGWHGAAQISVDDQALRQFIRQAHEAGLEVYNVEGYYRWAPPSGKSLALKIIDNVLRFNEATRPVERFDGILLDIEPYLLNASNGDPLDWAKDHEQIWRLYLDVLDQIAEQVRAYNVSHEPDISLGECIPDFYEQQGVSKFETVSFQDVIDRVDFTWLMCYRDTKESIIAMSQDEIRYASRTEKPIVLGLCVNRPTQDLGVTEHNTFWNEGLVTLEDTIAATRAHYSNDYPLHETAIFSYIHYKEMKP